MRASIRSRMLSRTSRSGDVGTPSPGAGPDKFPPAWYPRLSVSVEAMDYFSDHTAVNEAARVCKPRSGEWPWKQLKQSSPVHDTGQTCGCGCIEQYWPDRIRPW